MNRDPGNYRGGAIDALHEMALVTKIQSSEIALWSVACGIGADPLRSRSFIQTARFEHYARPGLDQHRVQLWGPMIKGFRVG